MPYTKFMKGGRYCIKNNRTKKVTCFDSAETRDKIIKIREAFSHGWVIPHHKISKKGRGFGVKGHRRRR